LVMSGTFYFAVGEQWDESKLKAYPAGTLYSEPARSPHYAWAKDGEVILQVTAIGPTGNVPIPQKSQQYRKWSSAIFAGQSVNARNIFRSTGCVTPRARARFQGRLTSFPDRSPCWLTAMMPSFARPSRAGLLSARWWGERIVGVGPTRSQPTRSKQGALP